MRCSKQSTQVSRALIFFCIQTLSKAKNADEDIQALGELVCDLLSYIANPKFYPVLQLEYETIDKIIHIITSAAMFAEDVAKGDALNLLLDADSNDPFFHGFMFCR